MQRTADAISKGDSSLPAPAECIVEALTPLVSNERLARIEAVVSARTGRVVPVLENIEDPHNAAAILRSADAFGIAYVHVVSRGPFRAYETVSKGAARWLEIHRHDEPQECCAVLREKGYAIFVAAPSGSQMLDELGRWDRVAVVFGNEHGGVSEEMRALADGTFEIPMCGFVESLNVSVAAAITMHALSRRMSQPLDRENQANIRARFLMHSVREPELIVERFMRKHEHRTESK